MPLAVKINVALREQNCQKIGSERVKQKFSVVKFYHVLSTSFENTPRKHPNRGDNWQLASLTKRIKVFSVQEVHCKHIKIHKC